MGRGRPARAGARATKRIELRLTLGEFHAVQEMLATADGVSVADAIRLALLDMAAQSGDNPPVILGRRLLERIVAGSNSGTSVK